MKYRLTLTRTATDLLLHVSPWDGGPLEQGLRGLISTQIVEDFTTCGYFYGLVRQLFTQTTPTDHGQTITFTWSYSDSLCSQVLAQINTLVSPQRYGTTAGSYIDMIGRTPLLRLNHLAAGCGATVLVKLESMEPGSVKDRPVLSMITQAIARGEINSKTEVVEASSGNVAFAMAAVMKVLLGSKPTIFIAKMHGPVKAKAVRVAGCRVKLTGSAEGSFTAKKDSMRYAQSHPGVFEMNQHSNPDNPRAHRLATGPELYHQCHVMTGQAPAEFVVGMGSGGTAFGVAMFREDIAATFKVIAVEPAEASLLTGGKFQPHGFSGLAPGFIPPIWERNMHRLDGIETVTRDEGWGICRRMLIEEGMLVGASSGASIAAALRRARLPENQGKVLVTIAHDRGDRYLGVEGLFVPPPEASEEDVEGKV